MDFSKSVTGKVVGPGSYQVQQEERTDLGKIGKGPKFEPNYNKNVIVHLLSLVLAHMKFLLQLENSPSIVQAPKK